MDVQHVIVYLLLFEKSMSLNRNGCKLIPKLFGVLDSHVIIIYYGPTVTASSDLFSVFVIKTVTRLGLLHNLLYTCRHGLRFFNTRLNVLILYRVEKSFFFFFWSNECVTYTFFVLNYLLLFVVSDCIINRRD